MSSFQAQEHRNLLLANWRLCKTIDDPHVRNQIADQMAAQFRQEWAYGGEGSNAAEPFKAQGHQSFDNLISPQQRQEVLDFLANKPVMNQTAYDQSISERTLYRLNEVPDDIALVDHLESDVLRAPHLLQLARHPAILSVVSDYIGCAPTISSMMVWHSNPTPANSATPPQIFHRDRDDFRFCKVFLYLTDVGPDNGPHTYFPYSHDWSTLKQLFKRKGIPVEQLPALFKGNGRHLDGAINAHFGPDLKEFTGQAGSMFLVNTYGFHKGKVPTEGKRILLQVTYTLAPLRSVTDQFSIQNQGSKLRWEDLSLDFAPSDVDRYMFRLYLD